MIIRRHDSDHTQSAATYSDCQAYRYRLTRRWAEGPALAFVMLNPSTADERRNDPTIARCENRARAMEFAAVDIVNLFGLRATRPEDLKAAEAPEGPDNLEILHEAVTDAGQVIAAWGVHGAHRNQAQRVLDQISTTPLYVLGLTKAGHPRHPLYIPKAQEPFLWSR